MEQRQRYEHDDQADNPAHRKTEGDATCTRRTAQSKQERDGHDSRSAVCERLCSQVSSVRHGPLANGVVGRKQQGTYFTGSPLRRIPGYR
jgi:hypothetical protein